MRLPNFVHIDLPSDNVRAIFLKIIESEYGDEQAYAGRDCRTRLGRPNSQARTRDREIFIFPAQLTTSKIGNLIRLIILLLHVCDHTWRL